MIACGYTYILTLVQAKLYFDATQVTMITKALESVANPLNNNNVPPEGGNPGQVQLSQPMEWGLEFWRKATKVVIQQKADIQAQDFIHSPATPKVVYLESQLWKDFTHPNPPESNVVPPSAIGVHMGDNAQITKKIQIEIHGRVEEGTAICIDRAKAAELASINSTPGGSIIVKKGLEIMINQDQGCVSFQRNENGFRTLSLEEIRVVKENSESPSSPADHDLQAISFKGV